jgi:hypothetical protein
MVATEHNRQLTSRWGGVKRLIALFMCYLAPLNLVVSNCCVGTVYYCIQPPSPNRQHQLKLPSLPPKAQPSTRLQSRRGKHSHHGHLRQANPCKTRPLILGTRHPQQWLPDFCQPILALGQTSFCTA